MLSPVEAFSFSSSLRNKDKNGMLRGFTVLFAIFVLPNISNAAEGKGVRFWNLTADTITSLQLSPAGKDAWGPDQCANDKDGTVDHDERLKIVGVEPGLYDAKFRDKKRECIVRNVEIKAGGVFSIEEKALGGGFCRPL